MIYGPVDELPDAADPVGATEVADLLGVERTTVAQWQTRGNLPSRDWTVGGRPAWRWDTIREWAVRTGRAQRETFPLAAQLRHGVRDATWTSADRAVVLHIWRVSPGRPGELDRWAWHVLLDREIAATGSMSPVTQDPDPNQDGLTALNKLIRMIRADQLVTDNVHPDHPSGLVHQRTMEHESDLIGVEAMVLDRAESLGEQP